MNILNRSAITITPKQPFVDWANALTPELPMQLDVLGESHTYLTNPDFDNAEKHLKKYFKQVFEEELEAIWTDENDWPQKRDFQTFCLWFDFEISDWVQDLSNKSLF
jgi:hypothetical protein